MIDWILGIHLSPTQRPSESIITEKKKRIGNYLLEKLKGEKWPELSLAAHPNDKNINLLCSFNFFSFLFYFLVI